MKINLICLGLFLLAISCKKNDDSDDTVPFTSIGSSKDAPGFGDNNNVVPLGTDFVMPRKMRFVDRPNNRFDPDLSKLYGINNKFYVELNIVNDSIEAGSRFIEFPPGMVMMNVRNDPDRQNGMLMSRVRINVPPTFGGPGGLDDTTTIYLGLACLNGGMLVGWYDLPDDPDTKMYPIAKGQYGIKKVSTDPNMLKLISLLEKYDLRLKHHYTVPEIKDNVRKPEQEIYEHIQSAVWDITDGNGISEYGLKILMEQLEPYKK